MDWWDEDPELLNAALYMLTPDEAFGVHATSTLPTTVAPAVTSALSISSASSSSSSSCEGNALRPPPQTTEKKARRVINASRERQRDETRCLRVEASLLEAQLSTLKQRREEMLLSHRYETGEMHSVAPVWEMWATRQVRELQRSEVVNARLKKLVEAQRKVADDLIATIREADGESKRLQIENALFAVSRPRIAIDVSVKISEEEQLQRLGVLCTRVQGVYEAVGKFRDGVSLRFLDMKLVENSRTGVVVDVRGSWAAPFPKATVEGVFCRLYLEETSDEVDGYVWSQDYKSSDDIIIGVFRGCSTFSNDDITYGGKYVGKRLRCPRGHMMLVSHSYGEPRCKSNLLEDVAVEEDSWFRIVDSHDVGAPRLTLITRHGLFFFSVVWDEASSSALEKVKCALRKCGETVAGSAAMASVPLGVLYVVCGKCVVDNGVGGMGNGLLAAGKATGTALMLGCNTVSGAASM